MAIKHDGGKPRFDLLPARAVEDIEYCSKKSVMDTVLARAIWAVWWDNAKWPPYKLDQATYALVHSLDDQHQHGGWGAIAEVLECGTRKYNRYNWCSRPYLPWSAFWRAANDEIRISISHTRSPERSLARESAAPHAEDYSACGKG